MIKILKNITNENIFLSDAGTTVNANSSLTINPTQYPAFASSNNIITAIGNGSIVVNDGDNDLDISDGIDLIKGDNSNQLRGIRSDTGAKVGVLVDYRGRVGLNREGLYPKVKSGFVRKRVSPGQTLWKNYDIPVGYEIEFSSLHAASRQSTGLIALIAHDASINELVANGGMNSSGDVSNWAISNPSAADIGTIAYSTEQAYAGTGSAKLVYTKSDSGHYNAITQTLATPIDLTNWRNLTAQFYNIPAGGGTYTRTISIVLYDGVGNTRKYDLSGTSITAPFNTSGWVKIIADIESPTSATGSAFDITNCVQIELRFVDSSNRAGTVYWDSVRFDDALNYLHTVYTNTNDTVVHEVSEAVDSNDVSIYVMIQNTGTVAGEMSGVWFAEILPEV